MIVLDTGFSKRMCLFGRAMDLNKYEHNPRHGIHIETVWIISDLISVCGAKDKISL